MKPEGSHQQPARWLPVGGLVVALLIPCFWQPRIQAGDLASHVYNAWLAEQIRQGTITGLTLAHPVTNTLADWALEALLPALGAAWAERLVAAAAVQIFFWGGFWLIYTIQDRRPWLVVPFLAMLSYGLIFHLGFLNFYLGLGLTFCFMALLWHPSPSRAALAIPVAILALFAHALPVLWGLLTLVYAAITARLSRRGSLILLAATLGFLLVTEAAIMTLFPRRWFYDPVVTPQRVLRLIGAEQFWLWGDKYLIIVVGILLIWAVLFLERLSKRGMMTDRIVHLWCLNVTAILLLPYAILLPGYRSALQYAPQRVSLFVAFLFCAMVGGGRNRRGLIGLSAVLAAAYFAFVYMDCKALNGVQARIAQLLNALPSGGRVVVALQDSGSLRLNGLMHVADGVCVGRCFDYANYEPSTGQFRVRALAPNRVVADTDEAIYDLEHGEHIVAPEEAPLYSVCPASEPDRPFVLKKLGPGDKTCLTLLKATPQFF